MKETISPAMARRIALCAQGFADKRPSGAIDRRHLAKVLGRIGLLQIDSVSVVVRAHYMPLFSRLGPYNREILDNAASGNKRTLFEYWAHEASFLPVETWPLMRWRMDRAAQSEGMYGRLARFGHERAGLIEDIYQEVASRGPIAASDIDGAKGSGGWWGWSDEKHAFEWLFWAGRITTASRRSFERLYDLPERVIPPAIFNRPAPEPAEAHRELLRISARALGIATVGDLRDYFRLSPADVKDRVPELVESGELIPVSVKGWKQQAYLHAGARMPRKIDARALLAPFDPLVFERSRAERLFDFRYRIEIYTPVEKRQFGYYVLPFLLRDTIVARVDIKADRPAGVLRVLAAYAEPGAPARTADELADELRLMMAWLGLERIQIIPSGDLGPALADIFMS
ncbi:MAG: winged helix-turn-helix domain-containing protein [Pseudaminobacter sp.]|nr:winged helix-turn-helix domain-containing protein [Pseudaminobacter sp.]